MHDAAVNTSRRMMFVVLGLIALAGIVSVGVLACRGLKEVQSKIEKGL